MKRPYRTGLVLWFSHDGLFGKIHGDGGVGEVFFHRDYRTSIKNVERQPKQGDVIVFEHETTHRGHRAEWWAFGEEFSFANMCEVPELKRRRKADQAALKTLRSNLRRFKVEDPDVIGEASTISGSLTRSKPVKLSSLLSQFAIYSLFDYTRRDEIDSDVWVLSPESTVGRIGSIDRELRFHYEQAPDLATFLAFAVASDIGREQEVFAFDPTNVAQELLSTLDPLRLDRDLEIEERVYAVFKRLFLARFPQSSVFPTLWAAKSFSYEAWEIAKRERFGSES